MPSRHVIKLSEQAPCSRCKFDNGEEPHTLANCPQQQPQPLVKVGCCELGRVGRSSFLRVDAFCMLQLLCCRQMFDHHFTYCQCCCLKKGEKRRCEGDCPDMCGLRCCCISVSVVSCAFCGDPACCEVTCCCYHAQCVEWCSKPQTPSPAPGAPEPMQMT